MKSRLTCLLFFLLAAASMPSACNGGPVTTPEPPTTATATIPTPPSAEELAKDGFILPELPRITAQQLRQMINSGQPVAIVDTRIAFFYNADHIPGAINIPYEPNNAQPPAFLNLPKDRPVVFYTDEEKDFDSAASVSRLLKMDAGFDPAKVLVLWKGYFWWKRLQYPVAT